MHMLTSQVNNRSDQQSVEDKYSCPHGWTRFGNKKCLKYVNELQDYDRAQATCRSKNQGTLVTIHSHEEQNFVYSYIHSIAASSTPIWLGAKQVSQLRAAMQFRCCSDALARKSERICSSNWILTRYALLISRLTSRASCGWTKQRPPIPIGPHRSHRVSTANV